MMCQLAWIYRFARFATAHEAGIQQTGDYRILSEKRTGCNSAWHVRSRHPGLSEAAGTTFEPSSEATGETA